MKANNLAALIITTAIVSGCSGGTGEHDVKNKSALAEYRLAYSDWKNRDSVREFRPVLAPDVLCIALNARALECFHSPKK